jgi:hypothetical protein
VSLRPRSYEAAGARLHDGWLVVPFDGDDLARVEIGVSSSGNGAIVSAWHAAFLAYADDQRVAQIRPGVLPTHGTVTVWLRVNGVAQPAGTVTL